MSSSKRLLCHAFRIISVTPMLATTYVDRLGQCRRGFRFDMPDVALGRRIRDARNQRGLTQQALADALDASRDTVWRMERGENVTSDTVVAALRYLGLDEPGLTSDAEPSADRQALARALLRAYDSSPAMALTLEAIAKPHLDVQGTRPPAIAPPADEQESAVAALARGRTTRGHR